jgi:hypothetical protein
MSKREIIDITVEIRAETEKAYQVFDGKITVWVPKSQVEYDPDNKTIAMPAWLATDKGFV